MTATEEGMMAQIWIAFGQGAGAIKVSPEAALELRRWYFDAITPSITDKEWEAHAVHMLDRMLAIGRLAASKAASIGASVITPREVNESASVLLERQGTELAESPEVSDQCMVREAEVNRDVRLMAALAATPAFGTEIANLGLLSDSALWNAAQTQMPPSDSERMEEFHRKQRLTGLSEIEAEELARLEQQFERVILVRSHSTSLLEKRGHDIRSHGPNTSPGVS